MPAYDNSAVAAKLDLYADLLEIAGEDKYRFLAYRKAANAIRAWPEQVAALATEDRLTDVPGIGAKMAGVVAEILEEGTFSGLAELSERIPPELASVMAVPGVGPKRAALLHAKLGVETIADLEDALASGRVERLGGFGAKTASKIAASLESHRRRRARMPIAEALALAESLVRSLAAIPGIERVAIAGGIRRRNETVGNIDLVVASAGRAAAASGISTMPAVERVLVDKPDHLGLELHDGTRVDARLVEPSDFGSALLYWTGSVHFGEALGRWAHDRGAALGAAGIEIGGEHRPASDEETALDLLGMPWIPPEARELPGVVDRAARGELPELVTVEDVRGDLQSHSTHTDGKSTLEHNREVAAELGYEYLAATDHAYALRMVGGLDVDDIERQWAEIDELNARGGPRILKGIELNIGENGELDYDDELLARFEIVLASLHSGWDQDASRVTRRVLAAIEHPLVDIIAHPTGRILGRRDALRIDVRAMLEAAGETGTIMEINSYPDRLDLSDEHIRLAREFGVRFSLGTDAHAAEQLRYMHYGVAQARRGLVTGSELLNAQSWDIARTWLKRFKTLG